MLGLGIQRHPRKSHRVEKLCLENPYDSSNVILLTALSTYRCLEFCRNGLSLKTDHMLRDEMGVCVSGMSSVDTRLRASSIELNLIKQQAMHKSSLPIVADYGHSDPAPSSSSMLAVVCPIKASRVTTCTFTIAAVRKFQQDIRATLAKWFGTRQSAARTFALLDAAPTHCPKEPNT
eukprot:4517581-Amphidinium_carterae.1